MTYRSLFRRIVGVMGQIRSASRVAAAVDNGRSPRATDLERLGISAVAFGAINTH